MAYKTLLKVSNVCQLLDKRKYPATTTRGGITFTNNGDGTITIDGTAIENTVYNEFFAGALDETHKYLFTATTQPCVWGQTYGMTCTGGGEAGFDNGNGKIFTNEKILSLVAYVWHKNTVSNLTFKPQLFDLTEMYGAGHEPTSVEQFRQDFPEEMYDYSPHCWLTSYKRVILTGEGNYLTSYQRNLTCKTKNLWTCDKTMFNAIYNSGTQVFKVINTGSASCYTLPTPIPAGTTLTITVYCLSGFITESNYSTVTIGGYHNETGNSSWQCFCNLNKNIDLSGKSFSNTMITTNTLTDFWIFVYGSTPNNLQFKVQLELGSTATDYVPYGYL